MKKNKLLIVIIAVLIFILMAKNTAFARVKGYIIKDTINNRFYQYDRDELIDSFLNNISKEGNNLLFLDYKNRLKNNKMYSFYNDSRKYVACKEVNKAFEKSKEKGEKFYLDKFMKNTDSVEFPEYVYARKIKNGQVVSILNSTKDGIVKDLKSNQRDIKLADEKEEQVKKISTVNRHNHSKKKNNNKDVKPMIISWNNPSGKKCVGDWIDIKINSNLSNNVSYINNVVYIMECTRNGETVAERDITVKYHNIALTNDKGRYLIGNKHKVTGDEEYTLNITFNTLGEYKINIYADS
ncbi:hypothetical protein OW763_07550 [Clostridium aestuarii]|uniref:Uncharacterized protein n=1 Tax=Clostridium aestuarii TaxID=338193 RepID=A0ABT4CZ10_9CLOT|nr:hypothetical protein [Clostridium aestuarii]MCY6484209.1 hypothetical protein [Clostridium aestuarii]